MPVLCMTAKGEDRQKTRRGLLRTWENATACRPGASSGQPPTYPEAEAGRCPEDSQRSCRSQGSEKRPWTLAEQHLLFGHWDNLMIALSLDNPESFFNFIYIFIYHNIIWVIKVRILYMILSYNEVSKKAIKANISIYMNTWNNICLYLFMGIMLILYI